MSGFIPTNFEHLGKKQERLLIAAIINSLNSGGGGSGNINIDDLKNQTFQFVAEQLQATGIFDLLCIQIGGQSKNLKAVLEAFFAAQRAKAWAANVENVNQPIYTLTLPNDTNIVFTGAKTVESTEPLIWRYDYTSSEGLSFWERYKVTNVPLGLNQYALFDKIAWSNIEIDFAGNIPDGCIIPSIGLFSFEADTLYNLAELTTNGDITTETNYGYKAFFLGDSVEFKTQMGDWIIWINRDMRAFSSQFTAQHAAYLKGDTAYGVFTMGPRLAFISSSGVLDEGDTSNVDTWLQVYENVNGGYTTRQKAAVYIVNDKPCLFVYKENLENGEVTNKQINVCVNANRPEADNNEYYQFVISANGFKGYDGDLFTFDGVKVGVNNVVFQPAQYETPYGNYNNGNDRSGYVALSIGSEIAMIGQPRKFIFKFNYIDDLLSLDTYDEHGELLDTLYRTGEHTNENNAFYTLFIVSTQAEVQARIIKSPYNKSGSLDGFVSSGTIEFAPDDTNSQGYASWEYPSGTINSAAFIIYPIDLGDGGFIG
jgi:hypothetical protein